MGVGGGGGIHYSRGGGVALITAGTFIRIDTATLFHAQLN